MFNPRQETIPKHLHVPLNLALVNRKSEDDLGKSVAVDYLQLPSKQLGKRPSQEDLGGDDKRLMEIDTTAEQKREKIRRDMKPKSHYVKSQVKLRQRPFCCRCERETGHLKDTCVKCDHEGCIECSFYRRLLRESKEAKVMSIQNDFEDR